MLDLLMLMLEYSSNLLDPFLFALLTSRNTKKDYVFFIKSAIVILVSFSWLTIGQIYLGVSYTISLGGYATILFLYITSFRDISYYGKFFLPCIGVIIPLFINLALIGATVFSPMELSKILEPGNTRISMVLIYMTISTLLYLSSMKINTKYSTFSKSMQIRSTIVMFSSVLVCALLFDWTPDAAIYPEAVKPLTLAYLTIVVIIIVFMSVFNKVIQTWEMAAMYREEIFDARIEKQSLKYSLEMHEIVHDLHHDLKNHFTSLKAYLYLHDIDGLKSYLSLIEEDFYPLDKMVFTKHITLNAVISTALSRASQNSISIQQRFAAPEMLPFSELDASVLLGNLLDNAIEATTQLPKSERRIELTAYSEGDNWIIEIGNSTAGNYILLSGLFLSTKNETGHGRGLKRIEQIVNNSGGTMRISHDDNNFNVLLRLPLTST